MIRLWDRQIGTRFTSSFGASFSTIYLNSLIKVCPCLSFCFDLSLYVSSMCLANVGARIVPVSLYVIV